MSAPPLGRMRAAAGSQPFRPKSDLLDDEVLDDDTRRMLMEDIQRGRLPPSRVAAAAVAVASPLLGIVAPAPPAGAPPVAAGGRANPRGPLTPPLVRSTATSTAGAAAMTHSAPAHGRLSAARDGGDAGPGSATAGTAAPTPSSSPIDCADTSASSLVSVLGSRLAFLEKQVAFLQAELKEKNLKLIETRDRLDEATTAVARGQEERHILARRLAEQNAFLAEYGLTFVGTSSGSEATTPRPNSGRSRGEAASEVVAPNAKDGKKFDLWAGAWPGAALAAPAVSSAGTTTSASGRRDDGVRGDDGLAPPVVAAGGAGALLRRKSVADMASRSPRQTLAPRDPNAPPAPQVPFDYEKFLTKCEHLTATVGFVGVSTSGKNQATTGATASLKHRDVVRIVVFADGITVHGGAFRPYGWALCDAFIQDILDGFFPYEYRDRYPDGFPIEVVDRRGEAFLAAATEARAQQARQGAGPYKNIATLVGGRVLGGAAVGDGLAGATVSRADLLKRLPQQHITPTGKVVDIRAGVAAFLAGPTGAAPAPPPPPRTHYDAGAGTTRVPTAAGEAYDVKNGVSIGVLVGASAVQSAAPSAAAATAGRAMAHLQVRFPDGQRMQLRLYVDETVGALRAAVCKALQDHPHLAHALFGASGDAVKSWEFQLTSVLPRHTWVAADDLKSLTAAGLAPSANLFVNVASAAPRKPEECRSSGWASH